MESHDYHYLSEFFFSSKSVSTLILGILAWCSIQRVFFSKQPQHPAVGSTPPGYPIIGNALDFVPEKILYNLAYYARQYGEILTLKIFGQKVYLISQPALVDEFLKKRPTQFRRYKAFQHIFGDRAKFTLFPSEKEIWARLRKNTAPSFSNQNLVQKLVLIKQTINTWVKELHHNSMTNKDGIVNMPLSSALLTKGLFVRLAFGIDPAVVIQSPCCCKYFFNKDSYDDLQSLFTFGLQFMFFPFPLWCWQWTSSLFAVERKGRAAHQRLRKHCEELLEYKITTLQKNATNQSTTTTTPTPTAMSDHGNLLEHLLTKEGDPAGLTKEEIVANMEVFFLAGSISTSIVITSACYYLVKFPEYQEKIRKEIREYEKKYPKKNEEEDKNSNSWFEEITFSQSMEDFPLTQAIVKETMRLMAIIFIILLETQSEDQAVELSNGLVIQPGDGIWLNIEGMLKNPEVFPQPEEFQPERWLIDDSSDVAPVGKMKKMENYFRAFGGGGRICPGMNLAMLEAFLTIVRLVDVFQIHLAPDVQLNEIYRICALNPQFNKLPLQLIPREEE